MNSDKKEQVERYIICCLDEAAEAWLCDEEPMDAFARMNEQNPGQIGQVRSLFDGKEHYITALHEIIANAHILITRNSVEGAEGVLASNICTFIESAEGRIAKDNPYKRERIAHIQYQNYTPEEFLANLGPLDRSLSDTYRDEEINLTFYREEMRRHHEQGSDCSFTVQSLLVDWGHLLYIKEIDYELKMLSEMRKKFENAFKEWLAYCRVNTAQNNGLHPALFWNLAGGEWNTKDFDILKRYAEFAHRNTSILTLIAELGRDGHKESRQEENVSKAVGQHVYSHAAKSDIHGITESDDLSGLLPVEIGILATPQTENIFYKRFAEKKLQTFSYRSRIEKYVDSIERRLRIEECKCGPFIVCLDTSGSMSGAPEELAKTICYALIGKAQEQRRNCFVISFSTGVEVIDIADTKNCSGKIVEFLLKSFNGGTNLTPALRKAIDMIEDERYRKADVLFISDFIADDFDNIVIETINAAKQRKTRFHALQIGDFNNENLLKHFNILWEYDMGQVILKKDLTAN